jgi:hypothetical protein
VAGLPPRAQLGKRNRVAGVPSVLRLLETIEIRHEASLEESAPHISRNASDNAPHGARSDGAGDVIPATGDDL